MHPEPSGEELQTSLHLYQLFFKRGLAVRMGPEGCGVIVDGRSQETQQCIAVRGDCDALRIQDEKSAEYHSRVPQVMHACGHDVHTTAVVGAISAIDALDRDGALPWPVRWRAVFQPAEETGDGAEAMIEAGALDGVEAIVALHVDPTRRAGTVGVRPGVFTASCDMLRVSVKGRGGHAARPHESVDPIAAAAQLISTLYQLIPRETDSQDSVVVSFGEIHGGLNANVIPEEVVLDGTVRTLSRQVRERTLANIQRIVGGVESVTGTKITVDFYEGTGPVDNDPAITAMLERSACELLGAGNVSQMPRPSMGSEDFAAYLEHVPGSMFRLGCAGSLPWPGLHTPTFDVDEKCIPVGAKILARTMIEWAKPGRSC